MSAGPPPHVRAIGRTITWLVARFPRSWTLLRGPTTRFFDRLAPSWHSRIGDPDRMVPLEAALERAGAEPARILDLGTGTGAAATWLAERFPEAEVVGVDVSEEMIRIARGEIPAALSGRLRFDVADASALPFEDAAFDLVTQVSVPVFFSETARVLAPRGHVIVVSSRGTGTPFHTAPGLLRDGFEREGVDWVTDGAAGPGTYYVMRKS
jgi:SAM-dependent methyltransferase